MKALITGASGFVGSHLVDRCLALGDEVRVLVRRSSDLSYLRTLPEVELAFGELEDKQSLAAAASNREVIYHAAARVADCGSRRQFQGTNVEGTKNLLDAARAARVPRFVFVSSPSVVADGRDQVDIDESHPYPRRYLNLYSETKAAAERLVLAASGKEFSTCAIRARGIWGPRDKTGFMPKIVGKLLAGRLPDLSGGRTVLASICHCDNAAEACVLAARASPGAISGKAYFVTDAEKTDVWAFARSVAQLFSLPPIRRRINPVLLTPLIAATELLWKLPPLAHHRSPPLSRYSISLLTRTGTYDTSAARRDLGYRPRIDRDTGLARLKAWVGAIGGVEQYVKFAR